MMQIGQLLRVDYVYATSNTWDFVVVIRDYLSNTDNEFWVPRHSDAHAAVATLEVGANVQFVAAHDAITALSVA